MSLTIQRNSQVDLISTISGGTAQEVDNRVLQNAITQIYQTILSGSFFQNLQKKAVWVWNTTVEALKSEWMVISIIAFAAYALFGFTVAVQASVVFACARFTIVTWQDQGVQKNVDLLTGQNMNLRLRNEELTNELEIAQRRMNQSRQECELHQEQIAAVQRDRDQIILQRAPLINENTRLQEQNMSLHRELEEIQQRQQRLTNLNAELTVLRDQAVLERDNQEGEYQRAIQDAQGLRERSANVETFENFNRILKELCNLYEGRRDRLASPDLNEDLFKTYRDTRLDWNQKLEEHIQTLDPNCKERIYLERILAASKQEADHFIGLASVMNLQIAYEMQKLNAQIREV